MTDEVEMHTNFQVRWCRRMDGVMWLSSSTLITWPWGNPSAVFYKQQKVLSAFQKTFICPDTHPSLVGGDKTRKRRRKIRPLTDWGRERKQKLLTVTVDWSRKRRAEMFISRFAFDFFCLSNAKLMISIIFVHMSTRRVTIRHFLRSSCIFIDGNMPFGQTGAQLDTLSRSSALLLKGQTSVADQPIHQLQFRWRLWIHSMCVCLCVCVFFFASHHSQLVRRRIKTNRLD